MRNLIKQKLPNRETLFHIYCTVYALMVVMVLYGIFVTTGLYEKLGAVLILFLMCTFFPIGPLRHKKRTRQHRGLKKHQPKETKNNDNKETVSQKKKKRRKKKSRPKKTSKNAIEQECQHISTNETRLNKNKYARKVESTEGLSVISNELRVSVSDICKFKREQKKGENKSKSLKTKKTKSVHIQKNETDIQTISEPANQSVGSYQIINDNDKNINLNDASRQTRAVAKTPDDFEQWVSSLREKVTIQDRVVNISALHNPRETLDFPKIKGEGFDSVKNHPKHIEVIFLHEENGVIRVVDSSGEVRWLKLPPKVNTTIFDKNQVLQLELQKNGSKFEVLSVGEL